jgi:hypothetical protein
MIQKQQNSIVEKTRFFRAVECVGLIKAKVGHLFVELLPIVRSVARDSHQGDQIGRIFAH